MWKVRRLVTLESGLKRMLAALSKRPLDEWWSTWSEDDQRRAREMFSTMDSGQGFVHDLEQGKPDRAAYRRQLLAEVPCPTLVTGSRWDGGVDVAHAEDLAATIPGATLVELDSPSHLFWCGPERVQAQAAVDDFLAAGQSDG